MRKSTAKRGLAQPKRSRHRRQRKKANEKKRVEAKEDIIACVDSMRETGAPLDSAGTACRSRRRNLNHQLSRKEELAQSRAINGEIMQAKEIDTPSSRQRRRDPVSWRSGSGSSKHEGNQNQSMSMNGRSRRARNSPLPSSMLPMARTTVSVVVIEIRRRIIERRTYRSRTYRH